MGLLRNWRRKRVLKSARIDEGAVGTSRLEAVLSSRPVERGNGTAQAARPPVPRRKRNARARGFKLTDDVRLSIAAQACLPILNLGLDIYDGWVGIVVYPGEFACARRKWTSTESCTPSMRSSRAKAWPGGPVILSWEDVKLTERGYNVVIHEFAHKIHMDGAGDADFPAAGARNGNAAKCADTRRSLRALLRRSRRRRRPSSTTTPPNTRPNSSPS